MRLTVPMIVLALLAGCVDPVCQRLHDAETANANACAAIPPTTAGLQQCDNGIGQCTSSDRAALTALATCLTAIKGCGLNSVNGSPSNSPVGQCAATVSTISSACGTAISQVVSPDAGS